MFQSSRIGRINSRMMLVFIFFQDHVLCFIQCTCSPVMSMPNFRTNVSETVQVAWKRLVFRFYRFLLAARPSRLHDLSLSLSLSLLVS